jgi:alpha-glucuronidase
MDRTVATGTGFIGQYSPPVARVYESLKTCPDELLLFMHHVPYTHVLHSGKTVIQHFYDAHYQGAEEAAKFVEAWEALRGRVDEQRYEETRALLEYQAGHALVWRDAVCNWFLAASGIADKPGRAGHHPDRVEAESMRLAGYSVTNVTPFEAASGGRAVEISSADGQGSASFEFKGRPGWYDLAVQYFDEDDGVSQFTLFIAGQQVDRWDADNVLPTPSLNPNAHTSARRNVRGLALRPGDEIRIEGVAEGGEEACLDYVEIHPATP